MIAPITFGEPIPTVPSAPIPTLPRPKPPAYCEDGDPIPTVPSAPIPTLPKPRMFSIVHDGEPIPTVPSAPIPTLPKPKPPTRSEDSDHEDDAEMESLRRNFRNSGYWTKEGKISREVKEKPVLAEFWFCGDVGPGCRDGTDGGGAQ
ncbi:hypothetical protein B0T20DRAFT_511441 [Sordaria brevicollis]|uniref:Uncharacterized protein n=1 Tax=Sordaria brevicollis TaxID=83679 RepID=A0AAE0NV85_SORBR|nr:hypothetical protein B0T20DRAFT_511441 [Sordaria brevicollis]